MRNSIGCCLLLALLAGGCATTQPAVPVQGSAADLSQLAGQWSGDYVGDAGGRRGVITFQLAAGADTAQGDVIMFPQQRYTTRLVDDPHQTGSMPTPQGLTIRFVRATGGQVSGQLDPYTDPECQCTVSTTFEGRLKGDVIEGHYISHRDGRADPLRGEWKVKRKRG